MTDLTDATNLELATRINDIVTKCAYIDSRMTNAEVQVFNEAARRLAGMQSRPPAATESTTAKLAALAVRMQEEMDWFMQAVESALNTISANVGEVTRSNDYLARRTSANVLSADFAALRTEHPELFPKEDGDAN